jgi:mannose-6-phosphate isomerase-like protein (cupin superfamily)
MAIAKIDIAQEATRLLQPFHVTDLGYVDDFAVSVFICQGAVAWHRHVDQDELFLVQSGVITLESDWGNVRLRPDEMAVVPKGVGHRSSSFLWSTVLLFQPRNIPHRKNGDRRTAASADGGTLPKASVASATQQLTEPFKPLDLIAVEDCVVRLLLVQGAFTWHRHVAHDELFLVFDGHMTLNTEQEDLSLKTGEMVIVPKGMLHRPAASERTVVLLFEKKALSSAGD